MTTRVLRVPSAAVRLAAFVVLTVTLGGAQSVRAEAPVPAEPPSAVACEAACAHKLELSLGHMGKGDRELPPEVSAMLETLPKTCLKDCTDGRLDPECLKRATEIQQTGVCEYYAWIAPEPAEERPATKEAARPAPLGAESIDALAAALRKALQDGDEAALRARFMPIDALLGCPNAMFGGRPPAKLREMRAQTLTAMKPLFGQFDVVHEKAIVSPKDLEPIEDGTYWTHYGLAPLPSCAIKGQLVARMPAQRKDEKTGNLAILAVRVGKEWFHLGVGFAGW